MALAALVAHAACSEDMASSFSGNYGDAGLYETNPRADASSRDSGTTHLDGAAPPISPLCLASSPECFPDDQLSCDDAVDAGQDAGTVSADASVAKTADAGSVTCRMGVGGASCKIAGSKLEGALCTASSDCGPGMECTGKPGTCRYYCCAGKCGTSKRFCSLEVRTEADPTQGPYLARAPVCVPPRACKLLSNDTCSAEETCAVVDDNGATSCVATGPAFVGESCELQNCRADLMCLGTFGSRVCLQLCSTDDPSSCPKGLKCKGSAPLFQEVGVGVCEKTMP